MKAKKYTEEQIITVLKEGEAGVKVADLCRKYGMSDATYYNWKAKYTIMTIDDLICNAKNCVLGNWAFSTRAGEHD
jgi:putative transposase